MALISDLDSYDEENDTVVLMTLHSAKGLEFDVVFLVGMEESVFPGEMSRFSDEDLEEERRLCYVGITRARKELYLSCSQTRMIFGMTRRNPPSRFLREIPEELLEWEQSPYAPRRPQGSVSGLFRPQRSGRLRRRMEIPGGRVRRAGLPYRLDTLRLPRAERPGLPHRVDAVCPPGGGRARPPRPSRRLDRYRFRARTGRPRHRL